MTAAGRASKQTLSRSWSSFDTHLFDLHSSVSLVPRYRLQLYRKVDEERHRLTNTADSLVSANKAN